MCAWRTRAPRSSWPATAARRPASSTSRSSCRSSISQGRARRRGQGHQQHPLRRGSHRTQTRGRAQRSCPRADRLAQAHPVGDGVARRSRGGGWRGQGKRRSCRSAALARRAFLARCRGWRDGPTLPGTMGERRARCRRLRRHQGPDLRLRAPSGRPPGRCVCLGRHGAWRIAGGRDHRRRAGGQRPRHGAGAGQRSSCRHAGDRRPRSAQHHRRADDGGQGRRHAGRQPHRRRGRHQQVERHGNR